MLNQLPPKVILIVDDDQSQQRLMPLVLESGVGDMLKPPAAGHGPGVLAAAEPSVLVIKTGMHDQVDGISLCEELLSKRDKQQFHVVVVTGEDSPELLERARALGLLVCFSEPLSPISLANLPDLFEARIDSLLVVPPAIASRSDRSLAA